MKSSTARSDGTLAVVKEPCPDCPFSRGVKPGALGGTEPQAYIGQVFGPFTLPCHKHCDFDDPDWKSKAASVPQCAGAAAFRTQQGLAGKLPPALPLLPPTDKVFADAPEFMAHHAGGSISFWRKALNPIFISSLVRDQIARAFAGRKP